MRGQRRSQALLLVAALMPVAPGCVKSGWIVETPAVRIRPSHRTVRPLFAEARVNGAGPFRLLLDSGAPTTLLAPDVARMASARGSVWTIAFGALALRRTHPHPGARDASPQSGPLASASTTSRASRFSMTLP